MQDDVEKEHRRYWAEEAHRCLAARVKIWLLCDKAKCHRLRRCSGDMRRCGLRLGEWAKVFRLLPGPEQKIDAAKLADLALVAAAMERIAEKWRNLEPESACPSQDLALFSAHAALEGQNQD